MGQNEKTADDITPIAGPDIRGTFKAIAADYKKNLAVKKDITDKCGKFLDETVNKVIFLLLEEMAEFHVLEYDVDEGEPLIRVRNQHSDELRFKCVGDSVLITKSLRGLPSELRKHAISTITEAFVTQEIGRFLRDALDDI